MTKRQKNKLIKDLKERLKRGVAGTLALYMFLTSIFVFGPSNFNKSYALTGGPSQPEVQSFEPIGTSDMVDLFSGDFTYNIPLLDVEGYPINLAYHSGVTMDEEASWVGLGWNVNVGTVNRALRGLPDDFKGDKVVTTLNIKPTITAGVDFEASDIEILGKQIGENSDSLFADLSVNVGMNYNNYRGVGINLGIGGSFDFAGQNGFSSTAGLGLNSSSSGGLSISPTLSLDQEIESEKTKINELGGKIGSSFNSRAGISALTIGSNITRSPSSKLGKKKSEQSKNLIPNQQSIAFDLMQPTYTPKISQSMKSFAVSGRLKLAPQILVSNVGLAFGASYSQTYLPKSEKIKSTSSYGYLYSEHGQNNQNARMDFNREKESTITPSTPNLALTNYTYDVYTVSGQGAGGSYRPFRGQVGSVFDIKASNTSSSIPITIESGFGNLAKLGGRLGVNVVNSKSGIWNDDSFRFRGKNKALSDLSFKNKEGDGFENYFFKEASEKSVNSDEGLYQQFGGDKPVKLALNEQSKYNVEVLNKLEESHQSNSSTTITRNYLNDRVKRNITIQDLTVGEVKNEFGVNRFLAGSYAQTDGEDHHIGQIVSLGMDGMRYVYGQPAYNTLQKEVSFAVGRDVDNNDFNGTVDYGAGLLEYSSGDNSTNNKWGLNHFYQSVETPGFAHSFLLTSVLSDDYVDVDDIKGPSDGDLGSYTKFSYTRIDNFKWRVPVQENTATYNEGLKGDPHDDKASYLYGEKELWYLDEIETKNFIAVFETEDRSDAYGVLGENGGVDLSKPMQALKKISLYSKEDIRVFGINATPLKEVHFVYDYELCPGIPNSSISEGKLTLKKVYFTYRDSQKGKLSPYSFEYQNNYSYDLKAYDRWGNYMPNNVTTGEFNDTILGTFEYPYTNQNSSNSDNYVSAWSLYAIGLPSGGTINMDYESDDYSFVQDKQAMNMVKIVNVGKDDGAGGQAPDDKDYTPNGYSGDYFVKPISDKSPLYTEDHKNRRVYFYINPEIGVQPYVDGIEDLYFRCLMEFDKPDNTGNGRYDFVSGYAEIESYGVDPSIDSLAYIELKPVSFNDIDFLNDDNYNPIALAGIQFGRLYLPSFVWDSPAFAENQTFTGNFINTLFQTFANFVEGFKNPNQAIYDKNRGTRIVLNKSWLRLNNVSKKKLGGGCRIKSISMNDNWSEMTADEMESFDYGQEYLYVLKDGSSSGVASYEPLLGGDENPFKQPVYHSDKKIAAPDDRFYQEEPFGESFFPSASVGYSRVVVMNKQHTGVSRNATGSVVHEFFTSKDFPTKVKKTDLEKIQHKSSPFSLRSIFKVESSDFMTTSQGFVVETNDMNGKVKSQSVFQENQNEPITSVEYIYLGMENSTMPTGKLENKVNVIHPDGNVETRTIGVNYDVIADFQESKTRVYDAGTSLDLDVVALGPIPIPIPTGWPKFASDKTMYRSATLTKVIQKFGILESTKATDLGSVVSTNNLAYDAETGQVLLTETATNFDDKVYSLNMPAYWYYDNMGPSYKNIGFDLAENNANFGFGPSVVNVVNGVVNTSKSNFFVQGDELALIINGVPIKAWVEKVDGNNVYILNKWGETPHGLASKMKVIRSGRRNMQGQMMASITTLSNPLHQLQNNKYEDVLQASAIEFSDEWRTYCDCNGSEASVSTNPYFIGIKGNYRPIVSYLHLSERNQSDINSNSNIRKDGLFKSFRPYYNVKQDGKWEVDRRDWTYTAEVTEFNPYGQELQNEDALGRESAAQFGYNQTLAKAVAANAGYRDIGFSSFEDDDFSECADNHFKFEQTSQRVSTHSHTGRYSIQVTPTNNATLSKKLSRCDISRCDINCDFYISEDGLVLTTITGGAEPYQFDYNVISGNPIVGIGSGGPYMSQSGTYKVEFIITDANRCSGLAIVEVENGTIINK